MSKQQQFSLAFNANNNVTSSLTFIQKFRLYCKMVWQFIAAIAGFFCRRPLYILLMIIMILAVQTLNFYSLNFITSTNGNRKNNGRTSRSSIEMFKDSFRSSFQNTFYNNYDELSSFQSLNSNSKKSNSKNNHQFTSFTKYDSKTQLKYLPQRTLNSRSYSSFDHIVSKESKIKFQKQILEMQENRKTVEYSSLGNIIPDLSYEYDQFFIKQIDGKRKAVRIISGAIHYFRMPAESWADIILKLKATGANTVETYMPWNLHEHKPGLWNFKDNLDIYKFLEICHDHGMFVILRPGPYICSEWDFGGLPAWLLNDPNMEVRTNLPAYLRAVKRYFEKLFDPKKGVLSNMMKTTNNGPIIAVQIENEYGAYTKRGHGQGPEHTFEIQKMLLETGVPELLFTSDGAYDLKLGYSPGTLTTVNFGHIGNKNDKYEKFNKLKQFQPDKPIMVMEFWTGWFDHWSREHHHRDLEDFKLNLELILNYTDRSNLNMYMFFGGTNFGFMNGANSEKEDKVENTYEYWQDTTSYDYDAPLSESGQMTNKFYAARDIISKALQIAPPDISHLSNSSSIAYKLEEINYQEAGYISLWDMIDHLDPDDVHEYFEPVAAEYLDIHGNTGQAHGYTLYTSSVDISQMKDKSVLALAGFKNNVRDRAQIFMSKKRVGFIDANTYRDSIAGRVTEHENVGIQILTENAGRVNYGYFMNHQRKGLMGRITTRGRPIINWKIYPLEFDLPFLTRIEENLNQIPKNKQIELPPGIWKFTIDLSHAKTISDTYIDMSDFNKGLVFVNGINLGRYWKRGPQLSLYWPKPYQKRGINSIMIFEEYAISLSARKIKFSENMVISFRQDVLFQHVYEDTEIVEGVLL